LAPSTPRLPLVPPSEPVRTEIASVLGRIAFEHADDMVGTIAAPTAGGRSAAVA